MKRPLFLICGLCWFLFGLGVGYFLLQYLAGSAGGQDVGRSLPFFGPTIETLHVVGIGVVCLFCFVVGFSLCLSGILRAPDHPKQKH